MGRHWLLPLYDPLTRIAGVGPIHEQLLDRADLRAGQRVLEIGCGTGNLLTALGRRGLAAEALGIDPDPAALRRARRKAARAGLPIRYEQAFADRLPAPDASFDRVLAAFMLHHLDEDEMVPVLREVRRVLRPGGQMHVVDAAAAGRRAGRPHRNQRLARVGPERLIPALTEAGLTGAAENGKGRARLGAVAFYRAAR